MTDAYIAVGDQGLADAFNLHAVDAGGGIAGTCFILGQTYSRNNQTVPGGVSFGVYERSVHAIGAQQAPTGTVPISIGVFITGAAIETLHFATGLLTQKLEQSMQAMGPQQIGERVVFWWRRAGEPEFTWFDVLGGSILYVDTGLPSEAGFRPAKITLYCLPYGRRLAITTDAATATLTAWTPGSQLYRGAVASQIEAPLTLQIPDLCTGGKVITRVRCGIRHAQPMLASDFTGIYAGITNAVTDLAGAVAAGATSIAVDSATGMVAGGLLLLDAGSVQEIATIAASYLSGTTIPLAAGLLYAHPDEAAVVTVVAGQAQLCPPATKTADATAANGGGNVARVAAGAAWKSLLAIVPNAGAVQNGRYTPICRVRDASAVLGATAKAALATPVVTPGGGTLSTNTYTAFWVPKNGANFGQPTGQVTASVVNLTPGGTQEVSTNVLFFDNDATGDFRYWALADHAAVANAAHTIWDGSSHNVYDLAAAAAATNENAQNDFTLGSPGITGIVLPKPPASGILSVRVRFKLNTNLTLPPTGSGFYFPLIVLNCTGTGATGIFAENVSGVLNTLVGTTVLAANGTVLNDSAWHVIEFTYDATGTDFRLTTTLDGLPLAATVSTSAANLIPVTLGFAGGAVGGNLYIGEIAIADQVLGNTLAIASGSSITFGIAHASGEASGFGDLFLQQGGGQGWYKVASVGNVASYTLSQWPPPSALLQAYPVITPVAPAQFRVGVAVLGRSLTAPVWGRPISALLSNGEWENLVFPPLDCPPTVRAEGQAQDRFVLILQCLGVSGGTPNCDADAIAFHPQEEDGLVAFLPPGQVPPAGGIWEIDSRYDGRVRAVIRDSAGTVIAQPSVVGQLMLGPGDNALVPICDVADANGYPCSDAINTQFALHLTRITPRVLAGTV